MQASSRESQRALRERFDAEVASALSSTPSAALRTRETTDAGH